MKLSVFVLCLTLTLKAAAQSPDTIGDIIDGLDAQAKKEATHKPVAPSQDKAIRERAAKFELPDVSADEAREKSAMSAAYAADRARVAKEQQVLAQKNLVNKAVATQQALQPQAQKPCNTPHYSSSPNDEAGQDFFEQGFVGAKNGTKFTLPQTSTVDFSAAAPTATHQINITVAIQDGSGWDLKDVEDTLAKTAKIYAQCGIRLAKATIVKSRFPFATAAFSRATEETVAASVPPSYSKPWIFFVSQRSDKESTDASGASIAYTSGTGSREIEGSAWIGHNSLVTDGKLNGFGQNPELAVGHELAHLLTDGDHQDGTKNILNSKGTELNAVITPTECAQMRANSKLVHPL